MIEMFGGALILLVGILLGWALARLKFDIGDDE